MTALRRYAATHPWITFHADLHDISWNTWLLLGEARSKFDHLAHIPLHPATFDQLHVIALARGALASVAIEGNTLSEEQALAIAKDESDLPPSQEYLEREVHNIITASNWVMSQVDNLIPVLTPDVIKKFNFMVLDGLDNEPEVVPGEYREQSVAVGTVYLGAPAEDCEYLVKEMCTWLNHESFIPDDPDQRIVFAIIRAILAHIYIAWIHPFGDGNGRTARLTEFLILVSSGVPSPAAHLLSNHYNKTRENYYRHLREASRSGGDVMPFLSYGARGLVDLLHEQLATVYEQILLDSWENYIHEVLPGRTTSAERQRRLILDLSLDVERSWLRKEIPTVSPAIAGYYAKLSDKTLSRDLKTLIELGLLKKSNDFYLVNIDALLQFLPKRVVTRSTPSDS